MNNMALYYGDVNGVYPIIGPWIAPINMDIVRIDGLTDEACSNQA
jgi:hypothetical protein